MIKIALFQNYPNPFNPVTIIRYQLPEAGDIELILYDLLGKKIKELVNERQPAGVYEFEWNGKNEAGAAVSSGIYLYRLKAGSFVQTRKMILIR